MSKRILIAEDEPNIVLSLKFLLERAGFVVASEANGLLALEQVLADPPAVLILDLMLPGLNGLDVLRRLREDPRAHDLPILMLTAKGQKEDRDTALACGANLFVSKPFANAEVVYAVNQLAGIDE